MSADLTRAKLPGDSIEERSDPATTTRFRLAHGLLIAVSLAYVIVIAVRTSQSMAFSWDEVVYLSQVVREVPDAGFSAPRSRGMPWLLAPVASFTPEIFPIRVYIGLVSGLLMYLAFRPWISVLQEKGKVSIYAAPLAAGLFATLWMTTLYGTMAYPNLWLSFGLVCGVGYYCLVAETRPGLVTSGAVGIAFAIASLLRPVDALVAAGPLVVASLVIRNWRVLVPVGAATAGLIVGWGAWIVEAFLRFDGPLERLQQGAEVNEGGLTWSLPKYLDSLDGPYLLCRPPDLCVGVSASAALWWILLPALVAVGLIASRRYGWFNQAVVAVASALSIALPYFLLFDYSAPRFLLPTYALLAIPTAAAFLWIANRSIPSVRVIAISALAVATLAHVVVQQTIFEGANELVLRVGSNHAVQAKHIGEEYGVNRPCLVVGEGAIQQSYLLQCQSAYAPSAAIADQESRVAEAVASGHDVVVRMRADEAPPAFMADWLRAELPGTTNYVAYLPPQTEIP